MKDKVEEINKQQEDYNKDLEVRDRHIKYLLPYESKEMDDVFDILRGMETPVF